MIRYFSVEGTGWGLISPSPKWREPRPWIRDPIRKLWGASYECHLATEKSLRQFPDLKSKKQVAFKMRAQDCAGRYFPHLKCRKCSVALPAAHIRAKWLLMVNSINKCIKRLYGANRAESCAQSDEKKTPWFFHGTLIWGIAVGMWRTFGFYRASLFWRRPDLRLPAP